MFKGSGNQLLRQIHRQQSSTRISQLVARHRQPRINRPDSILMLPPQRRNIENMLFLQPR
jgi:hypothetical protein